MVQRIAALDASYAAVKADPAPLDLARLGKPSLAAVAVEDQSDSVMRREALHANSTDAMPTLLKLQG